MTRYRSSGGHDALMALYDRRVARLDSDVESRWVTTRFGPAHLLVAGPAEGPPLLLLHGAGSSAVDLAETLGWVGQGHRQFFLDLPGEPNRTGGAGLDKSGPEYGLWMGDVLDGLGLTGVRVFGVSLGAFVGLKTASLMPERLSRLALLVPEGLARPLIIPFLKAVVWPALRWKVSPSVINTRRLVAAFAGRGAQIPEAFMEQMVHFFDHVDYTARPGPLFSAEELDGLTAPVLVVAGENDVLFPASRVERRARMVIPDLRDVLIVPNAGHVYFGGPDCPAMSRLSVFLGEGP